MSKRRAPLVHHDIPNFSQLPYEFAFRCCCTRKKNAIADLTSF